MRKQNLKTTALALLACLGLAPTFGYGADKATGIFPLESYGKIDGNETMAAYKAALEAANAAGGGIIVIPANADPSFNPAPIEQTIKVANNGKPPALSPSITIYDLRSGGSAEFPSISGFTFNRQLKLLDGQSLPHWSYYPVINIENSILRGGNSYREAILEDVAAGTDRKVYVPTVRGLFPGLFLNGNEWGEVQRMYVKALGYDKAKGAWYFVTDINADLGKGGYVSNKNHVNALKLATHSHSEGATTDVLIDRENYSQGDNYLLDARFKYMGDIHSTGGDENGVVYAAFVESMIEVPRGAVQSWDPTTNALVFSTGTKGGLGNGRPIINLNPVKWVTKGKAKIVRPPAWTKAGTPSPTTTYEKKSYPSVVTPATDKTPERLTIGGLIRLSADAPVTQEHVGWYFAVDEATEWVPMKEKKDAPNRTRRWYQIAAVTELPGADPFASGAVKEIKIVRHFNGAHAAGAPTLYREENYTWDGHERGLSYIIAPGANAYDVANAVSGSGDRSVKLSPFPAARTRFDFEKNDTVEQAIGADPFQPIPFRAVINEVIPAAYNFPVFDINNTSPVGRSAVLSVRSGAGFNTLIDFDTPANQGIVFNGANPLGSVVINQGRAESPIVFNYGPENDRKQAKIAVNAEKGTIRLEGNGVQMTGPLMAVAGLSGTQTPSANLRGLNVPVPKGATEIQVKFPKPEPDAAYAVFAETNFLSARAIVNLTPEGFTVKFEKGPEAAGSLNWVIVR
jgi:hypothetical protein